MPPEYATAERLHAQSTKQANGHARHGMAWRKAAIMVALIDLTCSVCGKTIEAGDTLTRGTEGNANGRSCGDCRPHHAHGDLPESCFLCRQPEPVSPIVPILDSMERRLMAAPDLNDIAQFFGVHNEVD